MKNEAWVNICFVTVAMWNVGHFVLWHSVICNCTTSNNLLYYDAKILRNVRENHDYKY